MKVQKWEGERRGRRWRYKIKKEKTTIREWKEENRVTIMSGGRWGERWGYKHEKGRTVVQEWKGGDEREDSGTRMRRWNRGKRWEYKNKRKKEREDEQSTRVREGGWRRRWRYRNERGKTWVQEMRGRKRGRRWGYENGKAQMRAWEWRRGEVNYMRIEVLNLEALMYLLEHDYRKNFKN